MISNFIIKLQFVLLAVGLLSACSTNSSEKKQILGKWINIGDQNKTLEFKEDKQVLRDKQDKLSYSFEREGFLSLKGLSRKEEYQIAFKGDTLIMLDAESRKRYFRVSSLDKPENFKYLVAQQLSSVMRKACKDISITEIVVADLPDSVHLQPKFSRAVKPNSKIYLADVTFGDESKTQLSILLKNDKEGYLTPVWRETIEAFTERSTFALIGVRTNKISLKEVKKGKYKGQISLVDGNILNIDLDTKKGWIPSDVSSMEIFTRYFVDRELGENICKKVSLATEDDYHYMGIAYMNDGKELNIQTDKLKGWSVKNTDKDVKTYITYQIVNGIGSSVQNLDVKKVSGKEYKVKAKLAGGELVNLFVSPEYRGWYPADEAKTLAIVIKYQMNAKEDNEKKALSLELKPYQAKKEEEAQKGQYVGIVNMSDGSSKKVMVHHKGKSFKWEVIKSYDKPKDDKASS